MNLMSVFGSCLSSVDGESRAGRACRAQPWDFCSVSCTQGRSPCWCTACIWFLRMWQTAYLCSLVLKPDLDDSHAEPCFSCQCFSDLQEEMLNDAIFHKLKNPPKPAISFVRRNICTNNQNCMYGITFKNSSYFCIVLSNSAPDGTTCSVTTEKTVWARKMTINFTHKRLLCKKSALVSPRENCCCPRKGQGCLWLWPGIRADLALVKHLPFCRA